MRRLLAVLLVVGIIVAIGAIRHHQSVAAEQRTYAHEQAAIQARDDKREAVERRSRHEQPEREAREASAAKAKQARKESERYSQLRQVIPQLRAEERSACEYVTPASSGGARCDLLQINLHATEYCATSSVQACQAYERQIAPKRKEAAEGVELEEALERR